METHPFRVPAYCHHKPTVPVVVTVGGRDNHLGKYKSAASRGPETPPVHKKPGAIRPAAILNTRQTDTKGYREGEYALVCATVLAGQLAAPGEEHPSPPEYGRQNSTAQQ